MARVIVKMCAACLFIYKKDEIKCPSCGCKECE